MCDALPSKHYNNEATMRDNNEGQTTVSKMNNEGHEQ